MPPESSPKLTIVGLGPGRWESLTLEAAAVLREAREVYVRTATQPSIEPIRTHLPDTTFHSFDHLYEQLSSLEEAHGRIVEEVSRLMTPGRTVTYAVPGSPSVGETTVRLLYQRWGAGQAEIRLIQGLSYVEPVLAAAGLSDEAWLQVLDAAEIMLLAAENAVGEVAESETLMPWRAPTPTVPLLISHLYYGGYTLGVAAAVKLWLGRYYGDKHQILLMTAPGSVEAGVRAIPLYELDRVPGVDRNTAIYVPPLSESENVRTFGGIMQLTRRLRGPGGCPWDREQTQASLKPYLLEETYEVLDALDSGDPTSIAEEFGDLLYQITLHAQVAAENGSYTIEDVIQNVVVKLIGRHPHVFGDLELDSAQDVRHAWEGFKQRQKPKRASVLEGIPRGLPALPQSNVMQKRAASVGFEWAHVDEVIEKVEEELEELRREIAGHGPRDLQRAELGDILFALVSVARHLRIDPEEALRLANRKFAGRFQHVEAAAKERGKDLRELSPAELDALWNQAKASEVDPVVP